MPALISQEKLIGDLLPTVYFEGITLESSGLPPVDDDPHIDHQRERTSVGRDEPNTLLVTADISLKEKLDTSLVGRWFGEDNKFKNFIKLMVVVSTNPYVTRAFSLNNEAISLAHRWTDWRGFRTTAKLIARDFKIKDPAQLKRAFYDKSNFQTRILTINQDVLGDRRDITQYKSYTDSDGNTIHDINFRASFTVREVNPKHLACFAVAYLDMPALIEAYNLDVDEQTLTLQNGKTSAEVVIDNHNMIGNTNVFYTSDGEIWTGPIHRDGSRFKTGSVEDEDSKLLTRSTVPNTKIQDFRDVKEIKRMEINLAYVEQELFSAKSKLRSLKSDHMDPQKKNAYFSNIYLARDPDGRSRFCFAVDYEKLARDHSLYGKLFETQSQQTRTKLLKSTKLRSLKLKRRRIQNVQTQNKLGAPVNGEILFDRGEYPITLAVGGEDRTGQFQSKHKYFNGVSMREANPVLDSKEQRRVLRFFTACDWKMGAITDGEYQYGVEMTVEDATVEFLDKTLSDLLWQRNRLHKYYLESTKLGMTKYIVEMEDPHIDSRFERGSIRKDSPGNYDPISNRFTQHFADKQSKIYNGERVFRAPWITPLISYITNLHMLCNTFESSSGWKFLGTLYSYISPRTGSPKGVMTVIKLMDDLIMKLSGMIGSDITFTADRRERSMWKNNIHGPDRNKMKKSKAPTKTSTIEYWFANDSFDSDVPKGKGYDYLSVGSTNLKRGSNGLRTVLGGEYKTRVEREVLRHFKSTAIDVNMKLGSNVITDGDSLQLSNYTFLSPSYLYLNNNITSLMMDSAVPTETAYNDDVYTTLEGSILLSSTRRAPYYGVDIKGECLPPIAQRFREEQKMLLAHLNLTFESPSTIDRLPLTDRHFTQKQRRQLLRTQFCDEILEVPDDVRLDPVAKPPKTDCDPEDEERCMNPNVLFMGLTRAYSKTGRIRYDSTVSPYQKPRLSSKMRYGKLNFDSIDRYDINNTDSIINMMVREPQYINTIMAACGYKASDNYSVRDAIYAMPIHLKSLFLSSVSSSLVNRKWHGLPYDPISYIKTSSYFKFNFGLINRVDVLVGYNVDERRATEKGVRIKEPRWVPLTEKRWNYSVGKELLCRLRTFHCKHLIHSDAAGLSLPKYDEYFFLRPPVAHVGTTGATDGPGGGRGITIDVTNIFDTSNGVRDGLVSIDISTEDAPVWTTTTVVVNADPYDCPPYMVKTIPKREVWCPEGCVPKKYSKADLQKRLVAATPTPYFQLRTS